MQEDQMKFTRRIAVMMLIQLAVMLWAWWIVAAPYQTYKKAECWWCHTTKVRLVVHHIVPQHIRPDLRDVESNVVTLCDPYLFRSQGCHFFWHKRNWTNNVTELQTLISVKE
jgi:hypothetical protein